MHPTPHTHWDTTGHHWIHPCPRGGHRALGSCFRRGSRAQGSSFHFEPAGQREWRREWAGRPAAAASEYHSCSGPPLRWARAALRDLGPYREYLSENTSLRILLLLLVNTRSGPATGQRPGPASTARSESRGISWPPPPSLSQLSFSDFHCESAGRLGHLDDQGPAGRACGPAA